MVGRNIAHEIASKSRMIAAVACFGMLSTAFLIPDFGEEEPSLYQKVATHGKQFVGLAGASQLAALVAKGVFDAARDTYYLSGLEYAKKSFFFSSEIFSLQKPKND